MRFSWPALALVLALAPPALAGSVRKDVREALKERPERAAALALEKALDDADSAEAAKVVVNLILKEDRPEMLQEVAVRALADMRDEAVLPIVAGLARKGTFEERLRGVEVLGRTETLAAHWVLMELIADPDAGIRTAVAGVLAATSTDDDRETFEGLLGDPAWTVRSVAAGTLAHIGATGTVPLLVDALAGAEGRLIDDYHLALQSITGKRFGLRLAPYVEWWGRKTGETRAIPEFTPPRPSFESPLFVTRSRRILFVLSVGQTMREDHGSSDSAPSVLSAVRDVDPALAEELSEAKTKLDVAKIHLRVMLRTLADGVAFDVASYSSSPTFAFGSLEPANDRTRKKAESRVKNLSPGGGGDLYGALLRAFDPRAKDPYGAADGPDTLVLLTDGNLAEPVSKDSLEVQLAVERWNRVRQLRFLVAAVGVSDGTLLGALGGDLPQGAIVEIP
jgi:VWA domain-containing protein/HEAT repeat protein